MIEKWPQQNHNIFVAGVAGIILAGLFLSALYYRPYPAGTKALTSPPSSIPSPVVSSSGAPIIQPVSTLVMEQLAEPLPLVYSDTLEEKQIQQYLKQGAVILPLGTTFGQPGNVVITAHSSGFESFGPYRFAFTKLGELGAGEEFQITAGTTTYTYRVYAKEIVWPNQVDRLPDDDRSTVTLVTCWPPWTNLKRLLVHSELVGVEK